jgi:2-polyprenyl-3-methyl-5-hydroxy-6-metoxy-1,4-benzoquinol methylase
MGEDIRDIVSAKANSLLAGHTQVQVLEAGCGSSTHVRLQGVTRTVGIDISKEQLEANDVVQEKLHGDIQEYPLPKEQFDVAICWMVLEHLPRPNDALLNMFASLKPKGILILGFPNLFSIKGLVTKFTPFWFHEGFYKFMKYTSRHFPTYLRTAILPGRLTRFAQNNGFTVEFCKLEQGTVTKRFRNRFKVADITFATVDFLCRVITLGKAQSLLLDNCFVILQKRG